MFMESATGQRLSGIIITFYTAPKQLYELLALYKPTNVIRIAHTSVGYLN